MAVQYKLTVEEMSKLTREIYEPSNNIVLTHEMLSNSESSADRAIAEGLDEDYRGLRWRLNESKNNLAKLDSLPYADQLKISRDI